MKDNKGFTLIELLAVVVILAVIMTLAIPNIVSTINKNKKETFIEDAKKLQASAEYKVISDRSLQLPSSTNALVLTLGEIEKAEITDSPYGNKYSKTKSFVVVTKEGRTVSADTGTGRENLNVNEYTYYVHLVSCSNDECVNDDIEQRYGINLQRVDKLIDANRFEEVVQAEDVEVGGLDDATTRQKIQQAITSGESKILVIPSIKE